MRAKYRTCAKTNDQLMDCTSNSEEESEEREEGKIVDAESRPFFLYLVFFLSFLGGRGKGVEV